MKYTALLILLVLSPLTQVIANTDATPQAVNSTQLTLANGDILNGEVLRREEGYLILRHEVLGDIQLAESQLQEPIGAGLPTPQALAENIDLQVTSEAPPPEEQPVLAWFAPDWDRQFDLGISGAEGNSQSRNIHTALSAKTETDALRWQVQMAYDSAEEDGAKSRDEFFAQTERDWLMPGSPRFKFASGRFDWDEFQDWDYRVNVAGGYGYDFVDRATWVLRGKAGLGANREFGGEEDKVSPEGLLEIVSAWNLSEHHKIEFTNKLYPQLDEFGEYRNITSLDWVNKLNGAMRLKIGLINEYDSDIADDIKHNDFKYSTSLSWDF